MNRKRKHQQDLTTSASSSRRPKMKSLQSQPSDLNSLDPLVDWEQRLESKLRDDIGFASPPKAQSRKLPKDPEFKPSHSDRRGIRYGASFSLGSLKFCTGNKGYPNEKSACITVCREAYEYLEVSSFLAFRGRIWWLNSCSTLRKLVRHILGSRLQLLLQIPTNSVVQEITPSSYLR